MNLALDKKILSYALKDKKYTMELSNSINNKYFLPEYQWLYNTIISHFVNPKFKEIPSREIVLEQLNKDHSNEEANKHIKLYDEVKGYTLDHSEFSWNLDKLRIRYNSILQNEYIKKIDRVNKSDIEDQ